VDVKKLVNGQKLVSDDEIKNNLAHHPPMTDAVVALHTSVRSYATNMSLWLNDNLPECDEKDRALEAVRIAMMWANAAVACHSNTIE